MKLKLFLKYFLCILFLCALFILVSNVLYYVFILIAIIFDSIFECSINSNGLITYLFALIDVVFIIMALFLCGSRLRIDNKKLLFLSMFLNCILFSAAESIILVKNFDLSYIFIGVNPISMVFIPDILDEQKRNIIVTVAIVVENLLKIAIFYFGFKRKNRKVNCNTGDCA